jgi:hypothetical protein
MLLYLPFTRETPGGAVAEAGAILNFKEVASKFKKIDEPCCESQYLSAGEFISRETYHET